MAHLLHLGENLTAADVFAIAQGGASEESTRARRIFESVGRALGIAIGNMVNIFNAPLYLLSGGPLPAWELFAPAMLSEVERRSFTFRNSATRIEKAALGGQAGLYGAACLPLQQAGRFQQGSQ